MKITPILALSVTFALFSTSAFACDNCSIFIPMQARELIPGNTSAALSISQFGYSKTRLEGKEYQEAANQNLKSNVGEIQLGYDLSSSFGLQANLPFVNNKYKRLEGTSFVSDDESGLGDAAVYARISLLQSTKADTSFTLQLIGGAKFPTGDSDGLTNADQSISTDNGIYDADLVTGTGSTDFPVAIALRGTSADWSYGSSAQYIMRTEGEDNYTYGNDIRWDIWLGKRLHPSDENGFEPRIRVSGITHEQDSINDTDLINSGMTIIFVGPEIVFSAGNDFAVSLRGDFPVSYENDGLQTLADHRVRLEISTGL